MTRRQPRPRVPGETGGAARTAYRPPMPAAAPGVFARCDAGHCPAPAEAWVWDGDYGAWLPACRSCAALEAMAE